jgi:hypothetical protein
MSRRVIAAYAEESMVARFNIGAQVTTLDVKRRACSELAKTAQQNYGFTNGFPSSDVAFVVLSSGMTFIFFHVLSLIYVNQVRMVNWILNHPHVFRRFAERMKSS